jgi:aspartyl-tRNA(Asn)/glutamyl-tRNA(Gln) amidotransferase subunit C
MKLSPEQVEKIATLSRLSVSEEEREKFSQQLSSILEWVDMMAKVDTKDVAPMQHAAQLHNVFGADVPAPIDAETRARLLSQFPECEGDLLKVKAVFS